MTIRKHIRLEERSAALLEQTGNISSYLSEIIEQRWRAAQQALAWLRDEGWTPAQIRRAMEVLGTTWEQGLGGCDAEQPQQALLAQWPGDERIDERACRALCLLAGEWWASNGALRLQMSDVPARPPMRKRVTTVMA